MAEATGFLYPFLDAAPDDPAALLGDLSRSAVEKWEVSVALRRTTVEDLEGDLAATADAMATLVAAGGRVLAFGNGGSAADAEAFVQSCASGPEPVPAVSLAADPAVLTALANDIGVDAIFARQIAAHGRSGDVAVAFSTSGGSSNVIAALDQARSAGLLTIGIVGYGGGALRTHVHHCLAVHSDSVHRIQEAQTAVASTLVGAVSRRLEERGP